MNIYGVDIDISTIIAVAALCFSLYYGHFSKRDSRNTLGLTIMSDCQSRFDECDNILNKLTIGANSGDDDVHRASIDQILNNMEYYAYLVNHKYLTIDESNFHKEWFMETYDTLKEEI